MHTYIYVYTTMHYLVCVREYVRVCAVCIVFPLRRQSDIICYVSLSKSNECVVLLCSWVARNSKALIRKHYTYEAIKKSSVSW